MFRRVRRRKSGFLKNAKSIESECNWNGSQIIRETWRCRSFKFWEKLHYQVAFPLFVGNDKKTKVLLHRSVSAWSEYDIISVIVPVTLSSISRHIRHNINTKLIRRWTLGLQTRLSAPLSFWTRSSSITRAKMQNRGRWPLRGKARHPEGRDRDREPGLSRETAVFLTVSQYVDGRG